MSMERVWSAFKKTNDPEARETLVERYLPLVKYIAGRMAIHLPHRLDVNDLMSYGVFGLLDAIEKYEPERDVKFETYASTRIRGSIIDGLRSVDWVPRSVRAKARQLDNQVRELENRWGRTPSDDEVADAMDLSLEQYLTLLDEVRHTSIASLDEVINGEREDEPIRVLDTVRDDSQPVDEGLLQEETTEALGRAIDGLPDRERLVLAMYYHESLTLKEIGHVLNISESRVCQLHTKAIASLKAKMES